MRIAREVAAALDYAHRRGVIHRDIKPENILLHDGQALVADFGIALAASKVSDTRMTETGMSLGTPMYMSPEQAMGERNLDARTDVYALGCVVFEMLAGEPPFTGPTAQAIVAKVLTDEPRQLTALRRSVPGHVEDAVLGALEKLPADRFGSAKEFSDALGGEAGAPRRRHAAASRTARARSWTSLTVALGVAVVSLVSVLAWQAWRGEPAPPAPVSRFSVDLPANARLAMYQLTGPNIAISPNGRMIVFPAEGPGGSRRLYARSMDKVEPSEVRGTEGASQPSFSQDGRWVAYLASGRLMRIALDGSAPQPVFNVSDVSGHTWTASGSIVVPDVAGRLTIVPASGGTPRAFAPFDSANGEQQQQYPVSLPDGEHVLYASWGGGGIESVRIGVASLTTGKALRLDLPGTTPLGMIDNQIIYVATNNNVLAATVDPETWRVIGDPVPVVSGVMVGAAGAAKAALSASGTLVYLGGARVSQMVLAGPDGRAQPVLPDERAYGYPRFSPDGKRIAVTIETGPTADVWIYDIASGTNTRLSNGGSVNERPEWSPDGSRVLFRTDRSAQSSIWWRRTDQSEPDAPLIDGPARAAYFEAVITPDGKSVVYQVDTSGADVAYRGLSGDTTPRFIANSPALENAARVSPDGRWVAFQTDESGSRQVVVQPFPGPGPRVQVSTDLGAEPVWSRGGKRLFYRGVRSLVVADYVTTPTFAVISRRELMDDVYQAAVSPHANFDVSPDGTKLLLLKGVDRQRLMVVQNWADEVRASLELSRPR